MVADTTRPAVSAMIWEFLPTQSNALGAYANLPIAGTGAGLPR